MKAERLSESEYVEHNRHLFRHLHQHDGLWWDQTFPGYCRPAYAFRQVRPGTSRPAKHQAWFGYSHHVANQTESNWEVAYLVLEGDDLRQFSMERLDSKKRNQVRKGLKCCEVQPIDDLERVLEDARAVCISHAERLVEHRRLHHVGGEFFEAKAEFWRERMRRDYANPGRRWWGAFVGGRLVAYLVVIHVENEWILDKMKVRTESLSQCPADALYFTAMCCASVTEHCERVMNSPPQRGGLDRFKEQYLFKRSMLPVFVSNVTLFHIGKRLKKLRDGVIMALRRRRGR